MATPGGIGVWLEEDPSGKGVLPMDRAIAKLRDEVTGVLMDRHRGSNRELAFVLAKLDEAKQWATEYLVSTGAVTIIPTAEIMRAALPVTTVTTDTKEATDGV